MLCILAFMQNDLTNIIIRQMMILLGTNVKTIRK